MRELIVAVAIVGLFVALLRSGRGKVALYCPECGVEDRPERATRGSTKLEVLLWACFLVPGLTYSVWRLMTLHDACPACGAAGMIPVSERGRSYRRLRRAEAR